MGFLYDFNLIKYCETKLLFFTVLFAIYFKSPSKFLFSIENFFFIMMFIPNLIIYEYVDSPRFIVYSLTFFLLLLHFSSFIKINIKFRKLSENQAFYMLFLIVILLLIPIFIRYKFSLNLNVLKFQNIYEVRSASSLDTSTIVGYAYSWLSKVILPTLLVFSVIKKRYGLTIFGGFVLMYLFVAQAHKSVFFGLPVVFCFYFFKDYYKKTAIFITGIFAAFILTHIIYITNDSIYLESILIRRTFFVPAILNTFYFDFFNNSPIYLSHSILKNIFTYPFKLPPANLIGYYYYHSTLTHANNGFISDGFMNFGYIGVIVYSILLVLVFKILDTVKINSRYLGVFFISIFTLMSSAFLTSLLTHGIIILIFLTIFIMQDHKVES